MRQGRIVLVLPQC